MVGAFVTALFEGCVWTFGEPRSGGLRRIFLDRLHDDQVGLASPAQHVRPVPRDAREAREAEGVTYTQHRHARVNESVESFETAARQATLEGHVMPINIHVPLQLAFHAVNDDPHSQAGAGACEVGRTPSTTPSTSSFHDSSSASLDLRRAVTVEGDRAVFSKIMQIATSAGDVCGRPNLHVHKLRQLCYRAQPEIGTGRDCEECCCLVHASV